MLRNLLAVCSIAAACTSQPPAESLPGFERFYINDAHIRTQELGERTCITSKLYRTSQGFVHANTIDFDMNDDGEVDAVGYLLNDNLVGIGLNRNSPMYSTYLKVLGGRIRKYPLRESAEPALQRSAYILHGLNRTEVL